MSAQLRRGVVVAALAAALAGLAVVGFESGSGISDTAVYQRYGEWVADGSVPYRDFGVEYPPGALAPFVIPALVTDSRDAYDAVFLALMLAALAAVAGLAVLSLDALRARPATIGAAVAAVVGGVALLGPFVFTRFDLYAAALALAATCAVLRGRERLGAVLLGVAIATKIYPAVLLPLLVTRVWRRDGRRAAAGSLGACVGVVTLVYLPFAIVAPEGVARSIWRQLGRPLQIESLASGVLLALHDAFGMPLGWASSAGSQNLTGTVAGIGSAASTIAGTVALVIVWVRFARGDTASAARFARYAAAATVAFVAFGKVISPQFLVWLLAPIVLVGGRRGLTAAALLLAACGLTRLWFPDRYWALVKEFDPTASWLVLVRDIALVILFVTLTARVRAREREPA